MQRKDFTVSERVEIGKAVEAELGKRQGQRTDLGNDPGGLLEELPQNFAEVETGESREIAAKKAGFGNRETYRQAKTVTEKAEPELVAAMDSGQVAISTAAKLAVTVRTFTEWVSNLDQADREARKAKIKDLYLKAYTAEEIGETVGSVDVVKKELPCLLEDIPKSTKVQFSDEDWKPPSTSQRPLETFSAPLIVADSFSESGNHSLGCIFRTSPTSCSRSNHRTCR